MSPIERWDPDTGQLVERRSHPMTPWASTAAALMFGAVAYLGVGLGGTGQSRDRSPPPTPPAAIAAPSAPVVAAVVFNDSSAYATASVFDNEGDTLVHTIFQFDSLRGDFTTAPILVDTQTYAGHPLRSDTLLNLTANDTFKVRALHRGGVSAQNSAWSAVDTFVVSVATVNVFMSCDWRNATDSVSTAAAVTTCISTGDLNSGNLNNNVFVVDTAGTTLSGAGWPAQKGLKVFLSDSIYSNGSGAQIWGTMTDAVWGKTEADTLLPGASEYRRIYLMFDAADSTDATLNGCQCQSIHPIETVDNNGEFALEFEHYRDSTKLASFFYIVGGGYHYDLVDQSAAVVPKDTTMRFEWEFRRTAVDSMTMHARVYVWNGSGYTLRWDDDDFVLRNSHDGGTGGVTTLADSLPHHVPVFYSPSGPFGPGELYTFKVGVNGWDAVSEPLVDFMYQGAWAVCRNDWCGAYPIAGVEN